MPSNRHQGRIVEWNDARGFGFIGTGDGYQQRLFFHVRDWRGEQRPGTGQQVLFSRGTGNDGRPAASTVSPLAAAGGARTARARPGPGRPARTPARPATSGQQGWTLPIIAIAVYAGLVGFTISRGRLPVEAVFVALLLCGATWIAYALDKRAAQHGRWRIPEAHLHLLELAGGWPGALLAQRGLRHKNRKRGYQAMFWCVVVLHTAGLAFWAVHA